jgi:hypothetical protein
MFVTEAAVARSTSSRSSASPWEAEVIADQEYEITVIIRALSSSPLPSPLAGPASPSTNSIAHRRRLPCR